MQMQKQQQQHGSSCEICNSFYAVLPLCRLVGFGKAAHLHFSFYFICFWFFFFLFFYCSQPATRFVWEQIRRPKVGVIETAVRQHFKIAPPSLHPCSMHTYTCAEIHTPLETPLETRHERLFACDRNAFWQCTCLLRFSATSSISNCCAVLNFLDACEIPDGSRRRGLWDNMLAYLLTKKVRNWKDNADERIRKKT